MGPSTTVLIGSFKKDAAVRLFIGCENEKASKDELLQNGSTCRNILSSNFNDLLEQIDNRCGDEKADNWLSDKRSISSSRIGCLKKELRSNCKVAWHLYDVAELWAALKNYLRHLPTCPLGSTSYTEWTRMQWNYMDNQRNDGIKCLLNRLQKNEYNLVKSIFRILHRISNCNYRHLEETNNEENKDRGEASLELAARLGPYMLWEQGQAPKHSAKEKVSLQTVWLISYMIDNYNAVF